ncbi:MAG: hypothetical protein FVQ82_17855 [Planctomycetes bacterium]|nr:hypothetical protein [Planctomycetota bacterium]
MRKRLIWTLALSAAFAVAVAAVAVAAKPTVIRAGNLVLKINGGFSPKALSKKKLTPIKVRVNGSIATVDGSHPPVTKTVIAEFDKNTAVHAKGLPVCKRGQLEARDTKAAKAACKKAIVGKGKVKVEVEFPEQKPFTAEGPLVLFNGGVKGKTTLLLIHAYVAVPAPTALVTPVKITRVKKGRFGIHTESPIPTVAGGSGSLISFSLTVNRKFMYKGKKQSYTLAKCPDGRIFARGNFSFKDGSRLIGTVIRPCRPKK